MKMGRNKNPKMERIYASLAVRRRLQGIPEGCAAKGYSLDDLADYMNMSVSSLKKIAGLKMYPALPEYLKLGEFLGWDLAHDVNYMYAKKTIPSAELVRRVHRLQRWICPDEYNVLRQLTDNANLSCEEYCGLLYSLCIQELIHDFISIELDD